MDVIADGSSISEPVCLMIGNFDGVHLGHQSIIKRAQTVARKRQSATAVLSFDPHPLKVLLGEQAPRLLQTPDQKQALLAHYGVDYYVLETFDKAFSALSPEHFVAHLKDRLNFTHLLVGFNFRFGHQRKGNTQTLLALGERYSYETLVIDPHQDGDEPISSSRIRELVETGETVAASHLLGRPYFLEGTVDQGALLGRNMNTPTANFSVSNELIPKYGVYASWCRLNDQDWYRAITNFGKAPTVARDKAVCETHLFRFSGSLYNRHIVVTLGTFLREEQKFENLAALKAQIQQDVAQRQALTDSTPPSLPSRVTQAQQLRKRAHQENRAANDSNLP